MMLKSQSVTRVFIQCSLAGHYWSNVTDSTGLTKRVVFKKFLRNATHLFKKVSLLLQLEKNTGKISEIANHTAKGSEIGIKGD